MYKRLDYYLFMLGKNWRISLAEIAHVLRREEFRGKIIDYSACGAVVEFNKRTLTENEVSNLQFMLGGTQKIAKCVDFIDYKTVLRAFPSEKSGVSPKVIAENRAYIEGILADSVYPIFGRITSKKYFIANSVYPVIFSDPYYKILVKHFLQFANKFWNRHLKEKGARSAVYYRYPQNLIESGNLNPIFPHHFFQYKLYKEDRKEIIYMMTEEGMYIGYTLNVVNSNEFKIIDEERPYKRMEASIPPKFAKVMINLLNIPRPYSAHTILDPFCGSGTILLFAYAQRLNIYGADVDPEAVEGTKRNLLWIRTLLDKPPKIDVNSRIIRAPVKDLPTYLKGKRIDGIATEPILLPYFRDTPGGEETERYIKKAAAHYREAFEAFASILGKGARVCLTVPFVETIDGGRLHPDMDFVTSELPFKPVPLLTIKDIPEKSDKRLRIFYGKREKFVLYDPAPKHLRRAFYLYEHT